MGHVAFGTCGAHGDPWDCLQGTLQCFTRDVQLDDALRLVFAKDASIRFDFGNRLFDRVLIFGLFEIRSIFASFACFWWRSFSFSAS